MQKNKCLNWSKNMQINRISFAGTTTAVRKQPSQSQAANLSQLRKYSGNPTTGFYPRLINLSPEQRFDYEMASGTKLSNGETLIKPVILSLGKLDIKKTDDGQYEINSSTTEKTLTMSEEELLDTKWLARGSIKEIAKDKFIVSYSDRDGQDHVKETNKDGAMKILADNTYYM